MRNKSPNLEMLAIVAKGLRGFKEKVAFIGGATIDLYISYPADAASRPTDDVDCVVELASCGEYYAIEEELRSLGFKNSFGKGPLCRWEYCGLARRPGSPDFLCSLSPCFQDRGLLGQRRGGIFMPARTSKTSSRSLTAALILKKKSSVRRMMSDLT